MCTVTCATRSRVQPLRCTEIFEALGRRKCTLAFVQFRVAHTSYTLPSLFTMSMIFRKAAGASSTTLLRSLLAAPTTSSAAAAAFSRPMSVSAMIQAGRGGFQSYGSREPSTPSKTLFVGGLSWDTTSDELREAFERKYGESVASSKLIWDRMQDRSKGSVALCPRSSKLPWVCCAWDQADMS